MKKVKYLIVLFLTAVSITAAAAEKTDSLSYPEIKFEKTTHDFGLFDRANGDKVCYFVFTNTGKKDLIILSASATCGCTEPEYPKTAVHPGMKDSIKVTYKGSTRRVGMFKKTIALTTNCKVNSAYLYIIGEMVEEVVADRVKPQEKKD